MMVLIGKALTHIHIVSFLGWNPCWSGGGYRQGVTDYSWVQAEVADLVRTCNDHVLHYPVLTLNQAISTVNSSVLLEF